MPLYEYECRKCGHRFEKIQKFSDPEIKKCPECAGRTERLLSAPAVQFKGSGWYVTDYARKSSTESATKASGDGAGSSISKCEGSDTAKTETKSKSEHKKPAKK